MCEHRERHCTYTSTQSNKLPTNHHLLYLVIIGLKVHHGPTPHPSQTNKPVREKRKSATSTVSRIP